MRTEGFFIYKFFERGGFPCATEPYPFKIRVRKQKTATQKNIYLKGVKNHVQKIKEKSQEHR